MHEMLTVPRPHTDITEEARTNGTTGTGDTALSRKPVCKDQDLLGERDLGVTEMLLADDMPLALVAGDEWERWRCKSTDACSVLALSVLPGHATDALTACGGDVCQSQNQSVRLGWLAADEDTVSDTERV